MDSSQRSRTAGPDAAVTRQIVKTIGHGKMLLSEFPAGERADSTGKLRAAQAPGPQDGPVFRGKGSEDRRGQRGQASCHQCPAQVRGGVDVGASGARGRGDPARKRGATGEVQRGR